MTTGEEVETDVERDINTDAEKDKETIRDDKVSNTVRDGEKYRNGDDDG